MTGVSYTDINIVFMQKLARDNTTTWDWSSKIVNSRQVYTDDDGGYPTAVAAAENTISELKLQRHKNRKEKKKYFLK